MRQSSSVWTVVLTAAGLAVGMELHAQEEAEGANAVLPWAYVLNDPAVAAETPDPDEVVTVPGSPVSMPRSAINIDNGPPDWHPDGHPRMPDVVAYGGREGVVACGYCHLPNGQGKPENAGLAGQPYEYLVQQMTDWRNGRRKPGEPRMGRLRSWSGLDWRPATKRRASRPSTSRRWTSDRGCAWSRPTRSPERSSRAGSTR